MSISNYRPSCRSIQLTCQQIHPAPRPMVPQQQEHCQHGNNHQQEHQDRHRGETTMHCADGGPISSARTNCLSPCGLLLGFLKGAAGEMNNNQINNSLLPADGGGFFSHEVYGKFACNPNGVIGSGRFLVIADVGN